MAKEKQKSNAWIPVVALIAAPFIGTALTSSNDSEPKKDAAGCLDSYEAFLASKYFVRQSVKAPDTAEISDSANPASSHRKTGDCTYRASGYVDAQNSFGTTLRKRWQAEVEYLPSESGWRVLDLTLDE